MKRILAQLALLLVLSLALHGAQPATPSARPNIILILADDMGFSDLGCYGGEIQTPNLDRLARGGLRFSQFYNCALCGPSRAALMTGLHPHQVGITGWTGLLNQRCVTACELLKRAGYATAAVGRLDMVTAEKWHDPVNIHKFVDRFLGSTGHTGPGNYFKAVRNTAFFRDGQPFTLPAEGSYKTDLITDFATQFITEAAGKEKPFFLYFAHYAPHWPLHAKPADIAKYRELYRQLGWDEARAQRHRRLLELGLLPPNTKLSPRDARAPAWSEAKDKDWEAERMATFAAQVDSLDQSVGRVMETLRRTGADKNTLVLFLSDNGASDQPMNAQLDKPGQTWRLDGTRTRFGNKPDIQPGPADNFVTAGPAWANVSNAPFRQHKQTNHEGGIASPLIAWWPGVVARTNGISPELAHITDITATCLDVAGVTYPAQFEGRQVQPLAGRSLLPVLKGGQREGHASLCWSTSGARAVRAGSWKLVSLKGAPWELYDLATDRTELNDLARQQSERVQTMAKVFEEWQRAGEAR
ncbi:MAG: arylsulfatase [Limisphaerales bacterium]|nr:MAG: arylsulfatase [Limisphaerales bacterium]KAG0507633.1 MAG: arylsulfatase [Limisphaerales bacterium]TXT51752.1 MAG: arylsulfatase [Limisphaerales bacterium]